MFVEVVCCVFDVFVVCYDVVVVEGVGSLVEINLCVGDYVNMGFVCYVGLLIIVVGDIDCGGVFVVFLGIVVLLVVED